MHAAKVVIELNQPPIEPPGKNRMHQTSQLLEKENVSRQWIPMPHELQSSILRTRSHQRKPHNSHRDCTVHRKITPSMRNVAAKYAQQHNHPTQINKRHPLKRPASVPNLRQPPSHNAPRRVLRRQAQCFHATRHVLVGAGPAAAGPASANPRASLSSHRATPDASPRAATCEISPTVFSHAHDCQPRSGATRASRRVGFTATPYPTAFSICRSPTLSP